MREGADVADVVDAQRGVLDQLRLPARQGRQLAVGAPLPASRHLQLAAHAGEREREAVLPRKQRVQEAAVRRQAIFAEGRGVESNGADALQVERTSWGLQLGLLCQQPATAAAIVLRCALPPC